MDLRDVLVVLVEPLYEINLGYVARAMKNFGFAELVLVDPKCSPGDEARKYAMHGRDLLERVRIADSLTDVLREVDLAVGTTGKTGGRRCYHRKYVTPEELGELLAETEGRAAILFGREDIGLTNEILRRCDLVATIPASEEYPVLNLSHAVAVVLYEVYKAIKKKKPERRLSSKEDRERLLECFDEVMRRFAIPPHRAEKAKLVLRRLMGRAGATKEEVSALLYVLRRISRS